VVRKATVLVKGKGKEGRVLLRGRHAGAPQTPLIKLSPRPTGDGGVEREIVIALWIEVCELRERSGRGVLVEL